MEYTEAQPATNIEAATILQRSVCLTLSCHYLGNHRAIKKDTVKITKTDATDKEIDPESVGMNKKLLDSKELRPAMRAIAAAKATLRAMAIPTHRVFGERTYLIPIAAVKTVDEELTAWRGAIQQAAKDLSSRYMDAVERQRIRLGPLFSEGDYVSPGEVEQAFGIDWRYVSFAAPDRLETVDRALFETAQAKYEEQMSDAYHEVRLVLRESLHQIVQEIVKKLTPDRSGKTKRFHGTVLNDLSSFLDTFSFRNLTDDNDLQGVVAQLRGLTHGLDADTLKNVDTLRENVLSELKTATDTLDTLVVTCRRAISLEDL